VTPTNLAKTSDTVLDQAIQWAVTLNSGIQTSADQQDFNSWLREDPAHKVAWQRMQAIEQELACALPASAAGTRALIRVDEDRRQRNRKFGGLLSLFVLLGLSFYFSAMWQTDYATAIGEQQKIQLAGGATLILGGNTAVDINEQDSAALIHLYRGQVFVDSSAASLAQKPIIMTVDGRFRPIGTRFSVKKLEQSTELEVLQGLVRIQALDLPIEDAATAVIAKPGERWQVAQRSSVDIEIGKLAPSPISPHAWVEGIIEADNAPLADVLAALAQHRKGWLYHDKAAADLRVTGVFRLDDTDSALEALAASMPITIHTITPWWVGITSNDTETRH